MKNLPSHSGLYKIICLYIHTSSVHACVCVCVRMCACVCVFTCVCLSVHVIYYSQVIVGESVCLHYSSVDVTIPTVDLLPTVCV